MKKKLLNGLLCLLILFASCSPEDSGEVILPELDVTSLTLSVGEEYVLSCNVDDCYWYSDEPFVAEVDENGRVSALHVGETVIHAGNATCKVTVLPKYHTYEEPMISWGATTNDVYLYMLNHGYQLTSNEENLYVFSGKYAAESYAYFFSNNKLIASAINSSYTYFEDIIDFLLERYHAVAANQEGTVYIYLFASIDFDTIIQVEYDVYSDTLLVVYKPYENG